MASTVGCSAAQLSASSALLEQQVGFVGLVACLLARVADNNKALNDWVAATDWVANLCVDEANQSTTSVCLKIVDEDVQAMQADTQAALAKRIAALLDAEGVAYDIGAYRDAPAGLRIWAGATVDAADLAALTPWLDWAFESELNAQHQAA